MLQKFIFNVAIKKWEIFPLLCWIGPFLEYAASTPSEIFLQTFIINNHNF